MDKKLRYAVNALVLLALLLLCACSDCDWFPGAKLQSKSGQYLAFTRGSNCGPLLSEFDSFVEIEHRYYIGRHRLWTTRKTVAGGKLSLDKLTLTWLDDHRLSVNCRCASETLDFADDQWRDVAVSYT